MTQSRELANADLPDLEEGQRVAAPGQVPGTRAAASGRVRTAGSAKLSRPLGLVSLALAVWGVVLAITA